MEEKKSRKKTLTGSVVTSAKAKTAVISVERLVRHQKYGKYMKRRVKYLAHDDKNECKAGDRVSIVECRPLSRLKRWRVKEILEKAG